MFFPEGRIRVFICRVPVDMRKSFDGLSALVRPTFAQDPLSSHCFVFVNRRATQMRVLYWDRTGYSLWAKRLERGRFWDWRTPPASELDWTQLKLLLEGIEVGRQRHRYHRQASENLAEIAG
ncbi:IS66 family insertion sequence element accessory protein TnpB [Acidithiobacillus sp. IBUN Pt1247-S3]|uniref:IS66 family insertion sequence element accessory protein TnpB n=1 Tax=Acidithiobacillus sp. IBUN Pt1247-S3 TaxID=3166642 RepID=UPI0034E55610